MPGLFIWGLFFTKSRKLNMDEYIFCLISNN
jgi:hypothetical protein